MTDGSETVAVIPARGGSKRVPGKNLRPFRGVPMVVWSIRAAIDSGLFDHVVCSTDDRDIASVARGAGASVPWLRPSHLADDVAGTDAVMIHAMAALRDDGVEPDAACCIYPSPFATAADLRRGHELLMGSGAASVITVVSFDFPPQQALRLTDDGLVPVEPRSMAVRSQDLEPLVHDAGLFYWVRSEALDRYGGLFAPPTVPLMIPSSQCQDINTEDDWRMAELKFDRLRRPS